MNTAEVETVAAPISFDTHHDDVIHDAKVDFYDRRLATASSDRTIRIFQINENETETLLSILSGHEGPVWQVAWAHPKFGSILASCSYDGSVIIWQEDKQQKGQNPAGTHSTWAKLKVHRVHDSSVNSISFAPHAFGLHLACASSDGKVSILSQVGEEWQSQVISAHSTGCNSVSWAPSAVPSSLFAVDFKALEEKPVPLGPKMIATGGCDNTVKLWKAVEEEGEDGVVKEKWTLEATLDDHADWVRDVCWRPNLGQVGHMLVSCSQDKTVLIWKLNEETKKWESKPLKQQPFPDTLWRVSFSEYGHLLAVSCGDNTVTIWRENFDDGTWELAGNVNETVTETVKIEEPLAVSPPVAAPIPEIQFTSSKTPKIVADVGYMKPMSPMFPVPSMPSANSTPGYQQFNQAYDDYQNAQTPTIPAISQPLINSGILASSVIPETTTEHVYSYDQPAVSYPDPQLYNQYSKSVEEFNKDIGFVTSSHEHQQEVSQYQEAVSQYENQQKANQYDYQQEASQYEAQVTQEQVQPTFEQPVYEEGAYEQANYEQPSYEQPVYEEITQTGYEQGSYDQTVHEQNYDQASYEQQNFDQTFNEQQNYDQNAYEQQNYDQNAYEQQNYEQSSYEQPTYEQPAYDAQYDSQAQNQYDYDQSAYDQSQYASQDQSSYYPEGDYYQEGELPQPPQEEVYNSYATESVQQQQEEQQVDYTLQYEGYNPSATYSGDATGF